MSMGLEFGVPLPAIRTHGRVPLLGTDAKSSIGNGKNGGIDGLF